MIRSEKSQVLVEIEGVKVNLQVEVDGCLVITDEEITRAVRQAAARAITMLTAE